MDRPHRLSADGSNRQFLSRTALMHPKRDAFDREGGEDDQVHVEMTAMAGVREKRGAHESETQELEIDETVHFPLPPGQHHTNHAQNQNWKIRHEVNRLDHESGSRAPGPGGLLRVVSSS